MLRAVIRLLALLALYDIRKPAGASKPMKTLLFASVFMLTGCAHELDRGGSPSGPSDSGSPADTPADPGQPEDLVGQDDQPGNDTPVLPDQPGGDLVEDRPPEDLPPDLQDDVPAELVQPDLPVERELPPVERPPELAGLITVFEVPPPFNQNGSTAAITEPADALELGCRVLSPEDVHLQGYSAGVITIEGGNRRITLSPAEQRSGIVYSSDLPVDEDPFDPGQRLTAVAAGGPHMGPFELTVPAPAPLAVREPSLMMASHDRGEPLRVIWTGQPGDRVMINIIPMGGFPPTVLEGDTGFCYIEDRGEQTVPAEVMAGLPRQASAFLLSVTRIEMARLDLGNDFVILSASTSVGGVVNLND